jgi:hypothetical protein
MLLTLTIYSQDIRKPAYKVNSNIKPLNDSQHNVFDLI